jgi:hypothetical protein
MEKPLPAGVRVEQELDGVRYVLPPRSFVGLRVAGVFMLGMGAFLTLFMAGWIRGPVAEGLRQHGAGRWFSIGFGLLGLPGLAAGLALLVLGIVTVFRLSHAEVRLNRDSLWAIERAGPLRWSRRRPLASIRRLTIGRAPRAPGQPADNMPEWFRRIGLLRAEGPGIRSLWLVPFYPLDVIEPLATALAATIGTETARGTQGIPVAVAVANETAHAEGERPVERPAGTDIVLKTDPGRLSILVPAAGLRKGSKGLFFFAIVWNGILAAIAAIAAAAAGSGSGKADAPPVLFMGLFFLVFAGIGVGVMLLAVAMGTRRVMIGLVGDLLAIRTTSAFGTREVRVRRGDIRAVRVGSSGMEVNDVPVMELQILPRTGAKIGLLSQRRNEELEWLAWELQKALGVGRE